MKNFEQFVADFKANEELKKKFRERLNKLRSDETLGIMEAGQRVARELGYEVSDDEAKPLIDQFQSRKTQNKKTLSDDELDNVAGGVRHHHMACGCWRNL